ncbi:MAG: Tryptophanyl-tRNA synthetase [Candidatus Methanohalarchaeum thermophilum]|uniref:Tryptophan--tRNA ligase n=1 Tax=Methanohalarchaeum thermophilum TaxID=1903181 RepID=A0A1Q6DTG5_METT1|nr:MAG: Tryptophanyl-tRNA synthetase [Candidatus Methanohalarchaeum thermophilum]
MHIDPWTSDSIKDYSELKKEFGIEELPEISEEIPNSHLMFKREIVFGHRDFDKVIDAIKKGDEFSAMSGFVPSGEPHLGHKMVMDQLIWLQALGGTVFVSVADMEAFAARNIPRDKAKKIGRDYLLSLIALGLKEKGSYFYNQSEEKDLEDLAFELSNNINMAELNSIYGFEGNVSLAQMYSTAIQSADILYPQTEKFGGPKPVVVPAGTDQDPHMRLVRDVSNRVRLFKVEKNDSKMIIRSKEANKDQLIEFKDILSNSGDCSVFEEHIEIEEYRDEEEIRKKTREFELDQGGYGFIQPSSTYHRFMSGLTGGKMSSSVEESYISLLDDPEEAEEKVMNAKTGGRSTLSKQKEEGGQPEKCSVYELFFYHLLEDEDEVEEIYDNCVQGERLCGTCKQEAADYLKSFLEEHKSKREEAKEELDKYM